MDYVWVFCIATVITLILVFGYNIAALSMDEDVLSLYIVFVIAIMVILSYFGLFHFYNLCFN